MAIEECRVKIDGNGVRVRFSITDEESKEQIDKMMPRLEMLFALLKETPLAKIKKLENLRPLIAYLEIGIDHDPSKDDNGKKFLEMFKILKAEVQGEASSGS